MIKYCFTLYFEDEREFEHVVKVTIVADSQESAEQELMVNIEKLSKDFDWSLLGAYLTNVIDTRN